MANEELKIRNLNRVLQTAYEQIMNYGIDNTTQVMLAKASGISKASIDRYFVNKMDCVIQTAEMMAQRTNHYLWEQMNKNGYFDQSGLEKLKIYMKIVKSMYVKNPRMFVLLADLKMYLYRNSSNFTDAFDRIKIALGDRALLNRIFLCGVKDGSMKSNFCIDDAVIYISEFYRELLSDCAMNPNPGTDKIMNTIDSFIKNVLQMVSSNNQKK